MVIACRLISAATAIADAGPVREAAKELPPTTRAAAMMAILAIALVGLLFVVVILLGGHWVRRQGRVRRGPTVPPDRAPLSSRGGGQRPTAPGETSLGETSPGRTAPTGGDGQPAPVPTPGGETTDDSPLGSGETRAT